MNIDEATKRLEKMRAEVAEELRARHTLNDADDRKETMDDIAAIATALDALTGHTPEPSADVSPALANEARAEQLWDDDRRLFVRNLGWLLSQTRCGVASCELYTDQDREYVIARYDHGGKREIDVTADSYLAIIKDVTKRV